MSREEKTINLATFRNMKSVFNEKIKPALEENFSDSTWQDFNDLKEYLAFVEEQATNKGIALSGIRFHFVATEDGDNQLTIALVPTYQDGEKHIDFDPAFSSENTPKKLSDIENESELYEESGSIMDRTMPCPKFC